MSDLFSTIFADEIQMPVASIWALIDTCRELKQTGIIRFAPEDGASLYLLLKHGDIINSYTVSSTAWGAVSAEIWGAWIDSTDEAYAKLIPLSPQGLLICKLLIQSVAKKNETFTRAADLGKYLELQRIAPDPSLVQLKWENSTGAILFSGPLETPHSLLIFFEKLVDQPDIPPAILNPENPHCEITMFGSDPTVEAWREYFLRQAFANICERILFRFQIMTGQALADSLTRLLVLFASRRNLNINITSRKVVDKEVFSSPQQAADSYRVLLTEMLAHLSGITGSRLLSSTLREVVASLPVQEREAIADFSLLSEGYIYERRN